MAGVKQTRACLVLVLHDGFPNLARVVVHVFLPFVWTWCGVESTLRTTAICRLICLVELD